MDSSPVVGPPSVSRPLRLMPFRGWRLAPGRIGDPAMARLFARPYRDVAARLARWRADGQLLEDPKAAVYVHEYTAAGLTVRGLVGALELARRARGFEDSAVIPHEGVHVHQVSELADRMETWELNPAPILLAHRGPADVRDVVDSTVSAPPLHEYVDRADQKHRVWALPDADHVDAVNRALAGSRALIADGHHRFAAYLRMQQLQPGGGNDRGLVMLVDQTETPLFVGAIHRVLHGVSLTDVEQACPVAARYASVLADKALGALDPHTLVATDGVGWATISLDLTSDRTAVEVLHDDLLGKLGLRGRRMSFHHSVEGALKRIRTIRGVAVLMPAPDFDAVVRVARAGRLLPEKATSFQPKPSVGALMRSLHDG